MTTTTVQLNTNEEMLAIIAKLQAENAALKAQPAKALTMKVSTKGALSIYGLGRFPVTLYASQWPRLFDAQDEIKAFLTANAALFAIKPTKA